jgi:protein involved in polysaccharide export with SLBB domain
VVHKDRKRFQFLKHFSRFLLVILFVLASATIAPAQEPREQVPPASPPAAQDGGGTADNHGQTEILQHRNRRYQLHSADVLSLEFPFTPEFNQTVTIQPDGYITLRGIENMRVEGQTLPEVTTALRAAYAKILHDPVINVELKDFEKPFFIVGGEVGHPGKFELREDTTTTEAVAIAGGLRDSAKHSQVLLFHRVPGGWAQVKRLNMKKMLKEGNLDEDAYLQPGDFLYVPKNTMSKIERFIPTSSLGMYANPAVMR